MLDLSYFEILQWLTKCCMLNILFNCVEANLYECYHSQATELPAMDKIRHVYSGHPISGSKQSFFAFVNFLLLQGGQ